MKYGESEQGGSMKTTLIAILFSIVSIANANVSTSRQYKDVTDYLHNLAKNNPQTTELFTLGFSNAGVAIEGVKIGNGPVHNLLVGTHHGNEYGSTEVALNFAESLAANPIQGQTMFVIPVLNIDGYNARQRWERINGQYIDQNRDYPGPCGTEGPFNSTSTKALADFLVKEDIVASATLHTYWPAAVYPWGISTNDVETPYTPIFMKMVQAGTASSQYQVGNSTEVIYPADGAFEDYAFWKQGIWSILFEVGNSHSPSVKDLEAMVKTNVPDMRQMFEIAPQTRAENHEFKGRCAVGLRSLDLHIE
jgi:predicted deacylase